jgi:uncharacterized protein YkwD
MDRRSPGWIAGFLTLLLVVLAVTAPRAVAALDPLISAKPERPAASTTTRRIYLPLVRRDGSGDPGLSGFALEVVTLTNAHRAQAGCPPLAFNSRLTQAAQRHSDDMARHSFCAHQGSDGSTPWVRIQDTGYVYTSAAENVAAGYSSPASVVTAWMNSPGHRNNILNCNLTEIGVGYTYRADDPVRYRHYWTQVFAKPRP